MLKEFKQFLLRGNVVDLAVGVVVGAAFSSIVNAFVTDILTPFISAIAKVPDFSGLTWEVNESKFLVGHFLNALISFLLVASAVFFFVVKPINVLMSKAKKSPPSLPNTQKCPECRSEIPKDAKRCAHCTQVVA